MSRHSIKPCDRHNYCSTKHKTESYKKKKIIIIMLQAVTKKSSFYRNTLSDSPSAFLPR